ncbi:MAG: hypothetical protein LUH63_01810 [Parabacteroides sp.]|nr:hypothetical protein [Parabacteroides sp.]
MKLKETRKLQRWLLQLLLFVSMFFAGGCDSDEDGDFDPSDYMEVELSLLSDWAQAFYYAEDHYVDKVYKNQKGIMATRGDDPCVGLRPLPSDSEYYMPLAPVNMPEEYMIEGVEIVFSGERINCDYLDVGSLPIILTDLKVKKNSGVIK